MSAKDTKAAVGLVTEEIKQALFAPPNAKPPPPTEAFISALAYLAGNALVDLSRCADALEDIGKSLRIHVGRKDGPPNK